MKSKTDEPIFEIKPSVSTNSLATTNTPLTLFGPAGPKNREEKWVEDECQKRTAIMKAIALETRFAHNAIAFLHVYSASVVEQTAGKIIEIKNTESNEELQNYMDQYCKLTLESLGSQSLGLNEVASARIAFTVHRDHYPPEEEPPGFWDRLLGK